MKGCTAFLRASHAGYDPHSVSDFQMAVWSGVWMLRPPSWLEFPQKKVAYPKNHGISKFWWELEIQQKSLQQKTSKPPLFGQEKPVILRVNMCHVCHPSFMSKLASWKGATGQRPARPKNIQSILRIWWLGGGEEFARFPK